MITHPGSWWGEVCTDPCAANHHLALRWDHFPRSGVCEALEDTQSLHHLHKNTWRGCPSPRAHPTSSRSPAHVGLLPSPPTSSYLTGATGSDPRTSGTGGKEQPESTLQDRRSVFKQMWDSSSSCREPTLALGLPESQRLWGCCCCWVSAQLVTTSTA